MRDIKIAITAASYSGNKGAAAMLQSSIKELYRIYGNKLRIFLMSVYPNDDKKQVPFDFVKVISCKPIQLSIAFPLAIIYRLVSWFIPFRKILCINKIIGAYSKTDLVIDEAGVSFVDSRGIMMNFYAFIQAATPMLVGAPVVKYSQALGEFNNRLNRMFAKIVLPKMELICARGEITQRNLEGIGIVKNVRLCADGAFSMPDDPYWSDKIDQLCCENEFHKNKLAGLSLSSVVEEKCEKLGIDYKKIMVDFIDYLNEKGFSVLIIANAARAGSLKTRNNDLMICDAVYKKIKNKEINRWYNEEMTAEQIRELISHCEVLVAARFHAMIGALEKSVPVLLIGWSHKYQEVLDMFGLGKYAIDYSNLSLESIKAQFDQFLPEKESIKRQINMYLERVKSSSAENMKLISAIIDRVVTKPASKKLLDINNPDKYIGEHLFCRIGYAANADIRQVCASGGMVTALLCHLLETGQIDGAWVTKSVIKEGELSYKTFVATSKEEILDCASSIYMYIPLLKHFREIMQFDGKIAVVMLPCQLQALQKILAGRDDFNKKIVIKIGLYCSGSHSEMATMIPLKKNNIDIKNAERIIYRRGHWRGKTGIFNKDGSVKYISFLKNVSAYRNSYFYLKENCFCCQDFFGQSSDISFGDVWLKEMKANPIKHNSCVIRTQKGKDVFSNAVLSGDIVDFHIGDERILLSQKRALVFKYNCAKSKQKIYSKNGNNILMDISSKCKWNHSLAVRLAYSNMKFSNKNPHIIEKIPKIIIFGYFLLIRTLLNW